MTPHEVRIVLVRHGERDRDLPAREDSQAASDRKGCTQST